MSIRIGPSRMARAGWTRVDDFKDDPVRNKTSARWLHRKGWRLEHCGHPTANHPWQLFSPSGEMILTGIVGPHKNPAFGVCWNDLASAVHYVLTTESW